MKAASLRPPLATRAGLGTCLSAALLGLLACPTQTQVDRRPELLQTTCEQFLRPLLAQARSRAQSLDAAVGELCAAPDTARLDAAQQAWWELREPWRQLRALPIGPLVDEGYDSAIDFWPARPNNIEGGVTASVASQAEIDALGVASKGLPALEYLLWDPVGGDEAILALLNDAEGGPMRCTYASVVAGDLALRFELFSADTELFAVDLENAGTDASQRYVTTSQAIDELLNAAIAGLHDLSERSLGKPLGLSSDSTAQADLLESPFSDRSRVDILDALAGFRRFYLGDEDAPGFTVIVSEASSEIDSKVRAQLDVAIAAAEALPEPLRATIDGELSAGETAWEEIKRLRLLLTADVAGLLGVTVSLSDNDGD